MPGEFAVGLLFSVFFHVSAGNIPLKDYIIAPCSIVEISGKLKGEVKIYLIKFKLQE